MDVGARWAGLNILQTADLLGFSLIVFKGSIPKKRNIPFPEGKWDVSGQRRMGRLVDDQREATVAQITTDCSRGLIQYAPDGTM